MSNLPDNPFAPSTSTEMVPTQPQSQQPQMQEAVPQQPVTGSENGGLQPQPTFPDNSINLQNQSFGTVNGQNEPTTLYSAGTQNQTAMNIPQHPSQMQMQQPQQNFQAPQQMSQPSFGQQPQFGQGGQFQQPSFQQQNNNEQRYQIIDMYWLVNQKVKTNEQFIDGECNFMTIGFNASFNNMRLTFFSMNPQDLNNSYITISNLRKITNCNIFSETAGELYFNKGTGNPVRIHERMFRMTNWTPNFTQITWNPDNIVIHTQDSQGILTAFTLLNWHITAFESCLNFLVDGSAWNSSLMSTMK